jgi:hypothetical protein
VPVNITPPYAAQALSNRAQRVRGVMSGARARLGLTPRSRASLPHRTLAVARLACGPARRLAPPLHPTAALAVLARASAPPTRPAKAIWPRAAARGSKDFRDNRRKEHQQPYYAPADQLSAR